MSSAKRWRYAQSLDVDAADAGGVPLNQHERRHVMDDAAHAAHEAVLAEGDKVVDAHGPADVGVVLNLHVPGQPHVVGDDHVVADLAVVGDVHAPHDQVVAADAGHARRRCPCRCGR